MILIKKVVSITFKLALSLVLGVAMVYGLLRFAGLQLIYPNEYQSLPVKIDHSGDFIPYPKSPDGKPTNVIILNVAGMGINQILATRYRYYGREGRLHMERMPVVGLINNLPLGSSLYTSPHAAATAMATGFKAENGKLSPPGDNSYPTILQQFKKHEFSTGIITNSYITGASTAAFGSNVESRSQQREIAVQMINSKIDVLIGGGNEFYKGGFGEDGDLTGIQFAKLNGYSIIDDKSRFKESRDTLLLGLFDGLYSNRYAEAVSFDPNHPTLAELVNVGIARLSRNDVGFLLLIDDEGTDFGGYSNRADYLTQHLKKIDEAVGKAIEFALVDKKTLVLVVSEAEAGGMVITGGDTSTGLLNFTWGSKRHTGQLVPLFAFGPGSSRFTGVIENTEIPRRISDLMELNMFNN